MRQRHRQHRLLSSAITKDTNLTCRMNILEIYRTSRPQKRIRPPWNDNLSKTLPWTLGCVVDKNSCVRHWEYTWVDRLKVRAYELHNTSSNSTTSSAAIFFSALKKSITSRVYDISVFWKRLSRKIYNVVVFPFAFLITVQQPFKPLWSRLLLRELEPSWASFLLCFKSLLMTLLPASVLEKDGEDQLDRSCEKWRSVT